MPLVLHDDTKQQLKAVVASPPHSLMIAGTKGIGKTSIINTLAEQLLAAPVEGHAYFKRVAASEGIEAVRQLQSFMTLKTIGTKTTIGRIAVIDEADELSIEAQNALLKLLEEPPIGSLLILSANQPQLLLPTIRSRSRLLTINRPSRDSLQDHFVALGFDAPSVTQAVQLGQSLPGVVSAILNDDADSTVRQAVEQARTILRATAFERLALVDSLAKQRPLAIQTLHMIGQMAEGALRQLDETRPADSAKRVLNWQKILEAAASSEDTLQSNGQAKLVLTDFMLSLP